MNPSPFPPEAHDSQLKYPPRPKQNPQLFTILSSGALIMLPMAVFIILFTARWIHIVSASNFTLEEGKNIPGTLILLSQNTILEQDSSVSGSVIMLCCNLTVDGKVNGNVFLLTGNLWLDPHADVGGDVNVISGNLMR